MLQVDQHPHAFEQSIHLWRLASWPPCIKDLTGLLELQEAALWCGDIAEGAAVQGVKPCFSLREDADLKS